MNKDFCRIITLLRKEKKLSQKKVAEDLNISQALLSHYEKGIRECGLDFLIKIADYYDVTCDYLLGRTPYRYDSSSQDEEIVDATNSAKATFLASKKLLQSTQNVIYDNLYKIGNRKLSKNVIHYMILSTYKMFRLLYNANEDNPQDMFAVDKEVFSGFSTAAMEVISARVSSATNCNCEKDFVKKTSQIKLSPETLAEEYPQLASSVFNMIQHAESNMKFKK